MCYPNAAAPNGRRSHLEYCARMRKLPNEATKCLKIKGFRFYAAKTAATLPSHPEKQRRLEPGSSGICDVPANYQNKATFAPDSLHYMDVGGAPLPIREARPAPIGQSSVIPWRLGIGQLAGVAGAKTKPFCPRKLWIYGDQSCSITGRGATGPHSSGTLVAKPEETSAPSCFSRKKEREKRQ